MNIHLLFLKLSLSFDILLVIFLISFVYLRAKKNTARTTLILMFCCVIVYIVSHISGISIADSELSRKILTFNTVDIFLSILTAHSVFAILGLQKKYKKVLISFYIIGTVLIIFFISNPYYFLAKSVPKMYLPNYYEAGPYYYLMVIFFFSVTIYIFWVMRKTYLVSNKIDKNRIKYFATALIFGYSIGSIAFLPVYDILVDPLWASFFVPFFAIPFTYGVFRYELMDIRLVAKNAFIYATISAIIGLVFIFLSYVNGLTVQRYPEFPSWVSSIILAFVLATAIFLIWKKIKEADLLKYEFITTITHKFRTPLTYIKWTSENLLDSDLSESERREQIEKIKIADAKLIELTNLLTGLSGSEGNVYKYKFLNNNFSKTAEGTVDSLVGMAKIKNIKIIKNVDQDIMTNFDSDRIIFVIQVLIENAIHYTPNNGTITISVYHEKKNIICSVKDTGIGLPKESISLLFSRFYRGGNARLQDTEGVGIGLYMAKDIIYRHGGKIWVESKGEGKGSTFYFSLPI